MSGTLTRDQLAAEVLDNLGRSSTLTLRSGTALASRVVDWLNRAQFRVARNFDFLYNIETASTVISQQSYAFPTNLNAVYSLRVENGVRSVKLKLVMPWDFDKVIAKPNEFVTGQPYYYIPYKGSGTFELYPVPDAAYILRLRCSVTAANLTVGSQTSDYTGIDDILIYFATSEGFKWLQEIKDASYWEARGKEALEDAVKAFQDLYPDWSPVAQGFTSSSSQVIGEYYNNPFITNDPGRGLPF